MKHIFTFLVALCAAVSFGQTTSYPIYEGIFNGTMHVQSLTFPTGAQDWAGFANNNAEIYPLSFANGGEITFKASATAAANLRFRFEANPFPDVDPAYETADFPITAAEGTYTVAIPSQGANTFNSTILYIVERDVTVNISEVKITAAATGPTCSDGIMNGDETGVDCGGTSCSPCPVPPTTAPTAPPARAGADVLSIYGEAYGAAVGLTIVEWDGAEFTEETIAGNKVLKADLSGSAFFGADLNTQPTDASAMTHFHVDYWVADAYVVGQVLDAKWSNHAGGAGETSAFLKSEALSDTDVQTWKSIDVEISTLTNTVRDELWQFIVSAANSEDSASLVYIDNVYFYKAPTASIEDLSSSLSIYPNPMGSLLTVEGVSEVQHANIFDLTGRKVLSAMPNKAVFTLDTADLQHGVYMLSLQIGDTKATHKLVK
jgi:endoglucanase